MEQQHDDTILTSPVLPLKNLFLPHINLLAKVKMRIGKKNQVHCFSNISDEYLKKNNFQLIEICWKCVNCINFFH